MRFVISHEEFSGFGGTETYMLTVAQALLRLGHEPVIVARSLGPMAEFARTCGVDVLDARDGRAPDADVVLAQDAASACELAVALPSAVKLMVCHSPEYLLQQPPLLEGVCQAAIALNDRVATHVNALAWQPEVVRLTQPIDVERFRIPAPDIDRPRRALVISNWVRGPRWTMIESACARAGLEVALAGVEGQSTPRPELDIAVADVVIGLGRGVLEAMTASRAAYVYGPAGGDGWVTGASYPRLEADGFSGRTSGRSTDIELMAEELRAWAPDMGEANHDLVRAHHDSLRHAAAIVELAHRLGPAPTPDPDAAREVARISRLCHAAVGRAEAAELEAERLRGEARQAHGYAKGVQEHWDEALELLADKDRQIREAQAAHEAAEGELRTLRSSRRVRFADRLSMSRLRRGRS